MNTEIVVAMIGTCGAIITGAIGYFANTRKKLHNAESALESIRDTLDYGSFLSMFSSIDSEIDKLIKETPIDRVMILNAWNGMDDPKWTTAVYQYRASGQEGQSYVAVRLDLDYIRRLSSLKAGDRMVLNTCDLPGSLIKDIYEAEGVVSSSWHHLDTREKQGKSDGQVSCCYVSFSSHTEELSPDVEMRCSLLADQMSQHVRMFYE